MTPGNGSPRDPTRLRIGLHPSLLPHRPEVSYVLRTLLTLAGYSYDLSVYDAHAGEQLDIYCGPPNDDVDATLRLACDPRRFAHVATLDPRALLFRDGLPWLDIGGTAPGVSHGDAGATTVGGDFVLTSFWLLSGASEPHLPRGRRDHMELGDAFIGRPDVLQTPAVSIYGAWLRDFFRARGREPLLPPWATPGQTTAFAFSHDVDYPEIIRLIEFGRVLLDRGPRGIPLAARVLFGRSHFWNFREWMAFERGLGARGAFYFMARRGSLIEYALGTPDGFYDVRSRRFRHLFKQLRESGFEIGLHASYHAHRSLEQLRREKTVLEEAAEVLVRGNRHHFWHLDPRMPHETLAMHEAAKLQYDSSLAFHVQPGFRRGICHPFRPYHPAERRALGVVQLPPAWMDDHFGSRLSRNGIAEPDVAARTLLDVVRRTGGVAVVDYAERGMNAEFFPRYGAWLGRFLREARDATLVFHRPCDLADMFETHEQMLEARSRERIGVRDRVSVEV